MMLLLMLLMIDAAELGGHQVVNTNSVILNTKAQLFIVLVNVDRFYQDPAANVDTVLGTHAIAIQIPTLDGNLVEVQH